MVVGKARYVAESALGMCRQSMYWLFASPSQLTATTPELSQDPLLLATARINCVGLESRPVLKSHTHRRIGERSHGHVLAMVEAHPCHPLVSETITPIDVVHYAAQEELVSFEFAAYMCDCNLRLTIGSGPFADNDVNRRRNLVTGYTKYNAYTRITQLNQLNYDRTRNSAAAVCGWSRSPS
jgi:hypothetical protein